MKDSHALEAPDLEPKPIFDLPTIIAIGTISLTIAVSLSNRLGTVLSLIAFLGLFFFLLRTQRILATKFPPGYWGDKLGWIRTKPRYYPGRPKPTAPLVKRS